MKFYFLLDTSLFFIFELLTLNFSDFFIALVESSRRIEEKEDEKENDDVFEEVNILQSKLLP